MAPTPELTARQRARPPWGSKRQPYFRPTSAGGATGAPHVATLAPGMDDTRVRLPLSPDEALIVRDRTPWYPRPAYTPPGISWVDWTGAGPTRPELSMRNMSYRRMSGTSQTRALSGPGGAGLHTNPQDGALTPLQLRASRAQMRITPQNRLSPARYSGQSYSQTTRTQGSR